MKSKKILAGLLVVCMSLACSKSDDQTVGTSKFNYEPAIYENVFYQNGETATPTTEWMGNVGQFGLENSKPGVSIDSKTGVISWDKTLQLGTTTLKVLAFNNAGIVSTDIQLENVLVGTFKGGFGRSTNFASLIPLDLIFNADGTSKYISYGFTINELQGQWKVENNNEFSCEYLYDESSYVRIDGKVIQSEDQFHLGGNLYNGNGLIEDSNIFRVDLAIEP